MQNYIFYFSITIARKITTNIQFYLKICFYDNAFLCTNPFKCYFQHIFFLLADLMKTRLQSVTCRKRRSLVPFFLLSIIFMHLCDCIYTSVAFPISEKAADCDSSCSDLSVSFTFIAAELVCFSTASYSVLSFQCQVVLLTLADKCIIGYCHSTLSYWSFTEEKNTLIEYVSNVLILYFCFILP